MSVLIKGMEMPDSCFHCKLAEVCQHYKAEHYANKRHEDCPLEEVPETHEKRTETNACDLISRQAAIDALADYIHNVDKVYSTGHLSMSDCEDAARSVIEGLPSAQPEVIRCTECKHYREYDSEYVENAVVVQCMADRYPISETIPDGWFCAGAERKDDE